MQAPSAATADEEQQQQQQRKAVAVKSKKCLSKQLSMCETPRDVAWERRRRQILSQERRKRGIPVMESSEDLTDEDLNELKGCIELGFGFNEEKGQHLTNTFPALDLYFAVNRQLSPSPVSTPNRRSLERQQTLDSPKSDPEKDWKICNPVWGVWDAGDHPDQVKTKLRHWAQAVACSVMQSY
ncbi:unnamed protein product [Linum tenue]|uniref:Uncharacterized protein n=1 Tax=Linum tenue TaxID=586396 RepID=A0AAV0LIF7_9ROSI|nr:unnamed protein product [Linum tenue]